MVFGRRVTCKFYSSSRKSFIYTKLKKSPPQFGRWGVRKSQQSYFQCPYKSYYEIGWMESSHSCAAWKQIHPWGWYGVSVWVALASCGHVRSFQYRIPGWPPGLNTTHPILCRPATGVSTFIRILSAGVGICVHITVSLSSIHMKCSPKCKISHVNLQVKVVSKQPLEGASACCSHIGSLLRRSLGWPAT